MLPSTFFGKYRFIFAVNALSDFLDTADNLINSWLHFLMIRFALPDVPVIPSANSCSKAAKAKIRVNQHALCNGCACYPFMPCKYFPFLSHVILSKFYRLLCTKSSSLRRHIYLPNLEGYSLSRCWDCIVYGFLQLVFLLVCGLGLVLQCNISPYLFSPYHPYCLVVFLKTNGLDLHIFDYRNDDRQINQKGRLWLVYMIRGVLFPPYRKNKFHHSPFCQPSLPIPSILCHCKKLWNFLCLPAPRIYQYICAVYYSYQASCAWSFPRMFKHRGGSLMGVIIT